MVVSESDRRELYRKLEDVLGKKSTGTIMSRLPLVG